DPLPAVTSQSHASSRQSSCASRRGTVKTIKAPDKSTASFQLPERVIGSTMLTAMRALALIAAYNEERFIGGCLEHLFSQGVEAYLCDNDSTDRTVAIAERYLGAGL